MNRNFTQPANCRSCAKPMYMLAHHKTGNTNPIDAEPSAKGNLRIDLENGTYRNVTKAEPAVEGETLYVSHFVTCPDAQRFKR